MQHLVLARSMWTVISPEFACGLSPSFSACHSKSLIPNTSVLQDGLLLFHTLDTHFPDSWPYAGAIFLFSLIYPTSVRTLLCSMILLASGLPCSIKSCCLVFWFISLSLLLSCKISLSFSKYFMKTHYVVRYCSTCGSM